MSVVALKHRLKLKKGDPVEHVTYGAAVFLRCTNDGVIWIRLEDGTEGTCDIRSLQGVCQP